MSVYPHFHAEPSDVLGINSSPGTNQVCLFRDSYTSFTASGFSIYGLSKDSPKANSNFKEKQKLQYPLLCDPSLSLISAIGLKKAPSGTTRGVFIIDKSGKVLASQAGSPAGTVEVAKKIIEGAAPAPAAPVSEPVPEPEKTEEKLEEKTESEAAPAPNGVNGIEANAESGNDAVAPAAAAETTKEPETSEVPKVEEAASA